MFGEYISSGQGTVDTLHLQDGGTVQVSAVDGDSPYIVTRSNPHCHCAHARSNGGISDNVKKYGLYGSLAVNVALLGYIFLKK